MIALFCKLTYLNYITCIRVKKAYDITRMQMKEKKIRNTEHNRKQNEENRNLTVTARDSSRHVEWLLIIMMYLLYIYLLKVIYIEFRNYGLTNRLNP